MKITLTENGEIIITSAELSSFARKSKNPERINFTESFSERGCSDVFSDLSYRMIKNGEVFIVTGEHDGIYTAENKVTVEKIKHVKKITRVTSPNGDPGFLADAYITAFLVCRSKAVPQVELLATIEGENGSKSFATVLSAAYLSKVVDALLSRCFTFAVAKKDFLIRGKTDIQNMPFPFEKVREGQSDLIKAVFRAAKKRRRLLAVAPTGTGKTISTLYPAVKALGVGCAEKVFYLTAKTVTGKAALEAVCRMNVHAPDLRAVMITAKERSCPAKDKKIDFSVDRCDYTCPRLSDTPEATYKERTEAALTYLLKNHPVCGKEEISKAAEMYFLCPYELSLDYGDFCQVIVCDYNYVFDAKVRFRRWFVNESLAYILLIDEAHNLTSRASEMYSAQMKLSDVRTLCEKLKTYLPFDGRVLSEAEKLSDEISEMTSLCAENDQLTNEGTYGYYMGDFVPQRLSEVLGSFAGAMTKAKDSIDADELAEISDRILTEAKDFIFSSEWFDEKFVFFIERLNDDVTLKIMCLDPSRILDSYMNGAVSTVLFSATLTPTDYFADITGCKNADVIEIDSPFDPDNLCIAAVDTVSTKYLNREETVENIVEVILTAVSAKSGNYIVYFPSYAYMNKIVKAFLMIAPRDIKAVAQKSGMSIESRNRFLSFFRDHKEGETLVGFCVMGGIFAEGIDLPEKMLIGSILVGMGLPGISSELNIMRDYYERTREDGYNFAYLYPAVIKILQAAGRVIRTENDRGIVVLIDERYGDPAVTRLLPPHWKNLHYTGDTRSLSKYLEKFWNREN